MLNLFINYDNLLNKILFSVARLLFAALEPDLEHFGLFDGVGDLQVVRFRKREGQTSGDQGARPEGDEAEVRVVGVQEDHPGRGHGTQPKR